MPLPFFSLYTSCPVFISNIFLLLSFTETALQKFLKIYAETGYTEKNKVDGISSWLDYF